MFEANLPLIRDLLRRQCARHRLSREDGEDFSSYAMLRILEDDYAVLRRFAGRSTLRTYLTTVTCRLLLDYRNQQWGKWHASARAKCLGGTAVRLETLIQRDGCSPQEAVARLLDASDESISPEALIRLVDSIPQRLRRRFEGPERLIGMPAAERADDRLLRAERATRAKQLRAALHRALQTLSREDRLILEMRFRDGITVRQIASTLQLESRLLYRRIERCLRRLRPCLEEGLSLASRAAKSER